MDIDEWQKKITYEFAIPHGFDWKPEDIDTMLLRIVSEVAEASEYARDNDVEGLAEELADVFIRLVNTAEVMCISLEKEVVRKHKKNLKRPKLHGRLRK